MEKHGETAMACLVGGLDLLDYFSHLIGNVIIPTDEVHHFSEG
jgi:hypothetical protein